MIHFRSSLPSRFQAFAEFVYAHSNTLTRRNEEVVF